jgi:hypothetical protein
MNFREVHNNQHNVGTGFRKCFSWNQCFIHHCCSGAIIKTFCRGKEIIMKKLLACLIVMLMLGGVFGVAYADDGVKPNVEDQLPIELPPMPIPD